MVKGRYGLEKCLRAANLKTRIVRQPAVDSVPRSDTSVSLAEALVVLPSFAGALYLAILVSSGR